MRTVIKQILRHALTAPHQVALNDGRRTLTYRELHRAIDALGARIGGERIAVMMDNGIAWAVVDLAIAACGVVAIPVPTFFTASQVAHLFADAAPDLLISDRAPGSALPDGATYHLAIRVADVELHLYTLDAPPRRTLPFDTGKITYTSGTTGQPKGVCVTHEALDAVTQSLADAVSAQPSDRSLTVLPLSTLLANIGGLYVPLSRGATAFVPPLEACGFSGSSRVDPGPFLAAFHRFAPTATILVPQLLKLVVEAAQAGAPLPPSLRFVAVGGAPCSEPLVLRARAMGIPVYEGYGLSEATSVVSMNRPGDDRPGSVGKPLPHVRVRIADDGEIVVAGSLTGGYLGTYEPRPTAWHTGDLGWMDADGFLYVTGRKKAAFATAYGRNVSPEWVESEVVATRAVLQAAVFGEGLDYNVAVVVPMPGASAEQVGAAIAAANARLPDYARLRAWCLADEPFHAGNGQARPGGALDRPVIAHRYAGVLAAIHQREHAHVHA
ncbi:AMP-binding protein [Luteibacter sahnii]|uniref:AMP-binding protein n=1 Tax=Luteibacter sahnii TaxID=3021977 RepID=UPI002A6A55BA|nr:AMP-binding protein [Luteibacter sp. PPL193]MDY1549815.1 AMP-binding protein [Luteibacter sp. PPL193]